MTASANAQQRTPQPSARERILAAYEDLLIKEGMRAATLDAVAAAAGVSKGGLLYHFKSKEALTAGLVDKLRQLAELDQEAMEADPAGCADYYVRTSVFENSVFDRTMVAATRLAQDDDKTVLDAFIDIHQRWYELILSDVIDPEIAGAVMLLGDGMYFNAAMFGMPALYDPTRKEGQVSSGSNVNIESLRKVVATMRGMSS